jgi:hypothetical protein
MRVVEERCRLTQIAARSWWRSFVFWGLGFEGFNCFSVFVFFA